MIAELPLQGGTGDPSAGDRTRGAGTYLELTVPRGLAPFVIQRYLSLVALVRGAAEHGRPSRLRRL